MVSTLLATAALLPRLAVATAPRAEDFRIDGDGVTLAARLYLPRGSGPFPAVVFTHGSGPSGRDSARYAEEAAAFADAGIASLVFDKRGYGESTGDWKTATFEDLADDAVAALRAVARRPEIRARCVGFRGASQSGWVLPLAASRAPEAGFVILISPPGVTPGEQVLYDVRTDLEDAGFSPADTEAALALTRSGLDYARTEAGWTLHAERLKAAAGRPWLDIASGPPTPDDWLWRWIRPLIDFDAVPIVERLNLPVLVLLGEQDRETPSEVAGYRLAHALQHDPRSKLRWFPDADHDLRSTTMPKVAGRSPFAPGFLATMSEWIVGLPSCGRP
jgi:pimeloyl-ACP methyl ester carboxylesterase